MAVAVLLTTLALTSCSRGGDGHTYVLELQGSAQVRSDGGTRSLEAGRHHLQVGQTVTVTRGSAVLGLPGHTSLELRSGPRSSTVQVGPRPTLVDGDALAVAGPGDDLVLTSGGATVDVHDGAARVRRAAGITVAVYQGSADVESLGRRLRRPLRALRQVTITDTGALPRQAVPLVYDRADPDRWDIRYLNDAIDLGGQLERRVRLLNARPAPSAVDAGYLEQVVPALRRATGFHADLVDDRRSVGETIVGASIALGGTGDLTRRWDSAFTFRDEGADWGLVALDQRARRTSVLDVLNGVLDRVVAAISPVAIGPTPSPSTGAPRGTTSTTTAPPGGSGSPTPTVPTTPAAPVLPPVTLPLLPAPGGPTPAQPSSPPTTILPPPLTVPQPVQGLLDGLLGTGGNGQTGLVGGALDTVGGLLGGH